MEALDTVKIGSLEIIPGENGSRVPFTANVAVVGDESATLIDAGAGESAFSYLHHTYNIEQVLLTHFHIDHCWGINHFKDASISVNPLDKEKMRTLDELLKVGGNYAVAGPSKLEGIANSSEGKRFQVVIDREKETYPYDEEIIVSGKRLQMIHTPGHCESFCCPFFPDEGVMVVGDYDLTSFGPWYNNADSNIDQMLASAEKTLAFQADHYVTLHHKGIFSRKEYERELGPYMNIIFEREKQLITAINAGVKPEDMIYEETFYREKNLKQAPALIAFEKIGIAKHLERLSSNNPHYVDYYHAFLEKNFKEPKYVHYYHR